MFFTGYRLIIWVPLMFIRNQSATILKTLTGEVRNINHLIIKQCSGNTDSRQICRGFDMHSFTHLQTTWSSIPMVFPHWQHPSLSGQCAPPDCSRMGWRTQKKSSKLWLGLQTLCIQIQLSILVMCHYKPHAQRPHPSTLRTKSNQTPQSMCMSCFQAATELFLQHAHT